MRFAETSTLHLDGRWSRILIVSHGLALLAGISVVVYAAWSGTAHLWLAVAFVVACWMAPLFCAAMVAFRQARISESNSEYAVEVQRQRAAAELLIREKRAAEAANRAKSDFLASMSHELRTPLNAVIGFSEMMIHEALGPMGHERYRDYAKDIHASGAHLLHIVNDILDIAKAESGSFELQEEDFNCCEVIGEAITMLRQRIADAGLQLMIQMPATLPHLRADRRRTKQVFLNLLNNAVKFTPSGGTVSISGICDPQRGLVFEVHDTGIGIAKENLAKVLQPFVQLRGADGAPREGTGLGLSLVRLMMERHGGAFELDSDPGRSTTARVIFPPQRLLPSNEPDKSDAPPAKSAPAENRRTQTVLIVDDDENLRQLLGRILVRGGYRAITAVHGADALKCIDAQPVDLVVTDMLMPEMDGHELLRALRSNCATVPVIAMSGVDATQNWLGTARQLGARATLQKPIRGAQLLQTIRQTLSKSPVRAVA